MTRPLVPENIRSLTPYPPGKPLKELERELGIASAIKLASNENAYGPSPRALEAMAAALAESHRYPESTVFYLRQRLARELGVAPGQLIFGNGSNEIIELLIRTFTGPALRSEPARGVLTAATTFVVYQLVSQAHGSPFKAVPMRPDLSLDLDAIAAAVDEETALIFLCNPNNPTGSTFDKASLERFLARVGPDPIVAIDEAYYEFLAPEARLDAIALIAHRPRTIVLRTFSKAYGLAGVRVGYGVSDPELVSYLDRVRQPFNVSLIGQAGAEAALDDADFLERVVANTRTGLASIAARLEALGCQPYPTEANFVLFDCHKDAAPLYEGLLRHGVIVRPMRGYGLPTFLRVNVGTPEENARFLSTFEAVLKGDA